MSLHNQRSVILLFPPTLILLKAHFSIWISDIISLNLQTRTGKSLYLDIIQAVSNINVWFFILGLHFFLIILLYLLTHSFLYFDSFWLHVRGIDYAEILLQLLLILYEFCCYFYLLSLVLGLLSLDMLTLDRRSEFGNILRNITQTLLGGRLNHIDPWRLWFRNLFSFVVYNLFRVLYFVRLRDQISGLPMDWLCVLFFLYQKWLSCCFLILLY